MIVFLNGKYVDSRRAKISIFDHGILYGDGFFETLRTYGGEIFNLDAHVERVFQSAERMRMPLPWKGKQVQRWIEKTLERNKKSRGEWRIRVTVTRGENDRRFLGSKRPTIFITAEPFKGWPRSVYTKGIDLVTFPGTRPYPEVKATSLLSLVLAWQKKEETSAEEAIFVDDGMVTEGTVSNLLCVKRGRLIIPQARILGGYNTGDY